MQTLGHSSTHWLIDFYFNLLMNSIYASTKLWSRIMDVTWLSSLYTQNPFAGVINFGLEQEGSSMWYGLNPIKELFLKIVDSYKNMALGPGVVLCFAYVIKQTKSGINFHFFFDSFFTLPLLDMLSQKDINATGTVRENRLASRPIYASKILKKLTTENRNHLWKFRNC